jgi:hypothetical protein
MIFSTVNCDFAKKEIIKKQKEINILITKDFGRINLLQENEIAFSFLWMGKL